MYMTLYKALIRGPNFKGRHFLESFLRRRLSLRPHKAPGGVRMILDPQEWIQIDLLRGHATEPLTAALFQKLLRPGDTLIDIGAHVGWLSLIGAKAVGSEGRVIAVDPQPYNCDHLLTNAQLNGLKNLAIVAGAVGDEPGPIRLYNQQVADKAKLTLDGPGVNDTGAEFLTQVYSLPQILEIFSLSSVRLLKVDVEGFEPQVFKSATSVLDQIDNIIFEQLPQNSCNFSAIQALLVESGFQLLTVNGTPLSAESSPPEHNIWARRNPDRST